MIATKLLGDRLSDRLPRRWHAKHANVPAAFVPGAEPAEDDPRGGYPYGDGLSITDALAALDAEEAQQRPQPAFIAAPPAMTAPQPVLRTPAGPMHAVPADGDPESRERAAAARAAVAADPLGLSPELLGRVLEGLKNLPVDRAGKFSLDKAAPEEGGLPFFRSLVRQYGWCGLHAERKPPARQRPPYTAGHWYADAMRLVAEATDKARYEVFGHLTAFTEQEQRIRTAENAANGLGYPAGGM